MSKKLSSIIIAGHRYRSLILAHCAKNLDTDENQLKLANIQINHLVALEKAFDVLRPTGLLTGENAQINFDKLIDAIAYVEVLTDAFIGVLAFKRKLLTEEDRQANFEVIVSAGAFAEVVWRWLGSDHVLMKENKQANINALAKINVAYAKYVAKIFYHLTAVCLLGGESSQANFDKIIAVAEYAENLADILYDIYPLFDPHRGLLVGYDQAKFDMLIKTSSDLKSLLTSLKELNLYSQKIITPENIDLLLASTNPRIILNFLAKKAQSTASLNEVIRSLSQDIVFPADAIAKFDECADSEKSVILRRVQGFVQVFGMLCNTDLFDRENRQANADKLVAAMEHAEILVHVFGHARVSKNKLLIEKDRQENFDAIIGAGVFAKIVWDWLNSGCILIRKNKQANIGALAKVDAAHAKFLTGIFNQLESTDLLKKENAQANFDKLIAAIEHVEILLNAFACVLGYKRALLVGEDRQANFDIIISAGAFAGFVCYRWLGSDHVLMKENKQANINALAKVNAAHAKFLVDIFYKLNSNGLFGERNAQANFDRVIKAGSSLEGLLKSVEALDEEPYPIGLITQEKLDLLLISTNPQILVNFLTQKAQSTASLNKVIRSLSQDIVFPTDVITEFDECSDDEKRAILRRVQAFVQIFGKLCNTDLFTGKNKQTNADKLVVAMEHAEILIEVCDNNGWLLVGEDGQAYLDVFITAGAYAKELAQAFVNLNSSGTDLLIGKNKQANREALVKTGKNIIILVDAFDGLLFSGSSLLIGEDRQTNFDIFIKVGAFANIVRYWLTSNHVLMREGRQTNVDVLAEVDEKYAEFLVEIFSKLENVGLFSEENSQDNFNKLVIAGPNLEGLLELLESIDENGPELLTQRNFNGVVYLDGEKAKKIADALDVLRQYSESLITQENLDLLLISTNTQFIVNFLTGKVKTVAALKNAIKGLSQQKLFPANAITVFNDRLGSEKEIIFYIVKQFVQECIFNFKLLERLLYLPKAQLDLLRASLQLQGMQLFPSHEMDKMLPESLAIATKYHLPAQLKNVPQEMQLALPRAGDPESSMNDMLVKQAKARFDALKEKFGASLQLEEVEEKIRRGLLEDIINEFEKGVFEKNQEAAIFVRDNIESLVSRSDEKIIQKALTYIQSNDSAVQIAWRSYEPLAKCAVGWPNLLTAPDEEAKNNVVYSTRASSQGLSEGAVTEDMASQHVREYAALCFLASRDSELSPEQQQAIWMDFTYYVAQVRRAHNEDVTGIDSPSCFPGTLPRLAQTVNKHKMFIFEKESKDVDFPKVVDDRVKLIVEDFYAEYCKDETVSADDKMLLYLAFMMLDLNNADEVIAKPETVLITLSPAWIEGMNESELIRRAMELRAKFLQKLAAEKDIYGKVAGYFAREGISISGEKIFYLVVRALSRLKTLDISLRQEALAIIESKNRDQKNQVVGEEGPFPKSIPLEDLRKFMREEKIQAKAELILHHMPKYQGAIYLLLKKVIPDAEAIVIVNKVIPKDELKDLEALERAVIEASGKELYPSQAEIIDGVLASVRDKFKLPAPSEGRINKQIR